MVRKKNEMTLMMISFLRKSPRVIMLTLFVVLMAFGSGCKSKKKALEAAEAEARKAKMEQEAALKRQNEEEQRKREAAEQARREAAEAAAKKDEPYVKLEQYFNAIGNAGSLSAANSSIQEALTLFATPETPVLIVISESAGQKDYDRPTTIKEYLNYLKDQKKRADKIGNLQFDSRGKITEVELVKQQ